MKIPTCNYEIPGEEAGRSVDKHALKLMAHTARAKQAHGCSWTSYTAKTEALLPAVVVLHIHSTVHGQVHKMLTIDHQCSLKLSTAHIKQRYNDHKMYL